MFVQLEIMPRPRVNHSKNNMTEQEIPKFYKFPTNENMDFTQ